MPLTPQEQNAIVDELLTAAATAGGRAAFNTAFDDLRAECGDLPGFAAFLADANNIVPMALENAARMAISRGLHATLLAKLHSRLPATASAATATVTDGGELQFGTHQGVASPGASLDGDWIETLNEVSPNVGLVIDETGKALGTAFLVGPDLVLTAAHVIWPATDRQVPKPKVDKAKRLWVVFYGRKRKGKLRERREIRVVDDWLEDASPPCGTPPKLALDDGANAGEQLDFALVRLDERIGDEISYIDISSPPRPITNDSLAVYGYPGGSGAKFSIDLLTGHDDQISRLRSNVSTLEGMSGSPCLTLEGKAIGVHEGTVRDAAGALKYNRSVYVGRIRKYFRDLGAADPLASSGRLLRWLPEAVSDAPLKSLSALPTDSVITATRHPVFGRAKFQEWIDAARAEPAKRSALIGGADGAGKTFSVYLLAAKLRRATDLMCVLPPEVIRDADANEIFRRLAEAAAVSLDLSDARTPVRPEAGTLRRDVIPDRLERLQRALTNPGTSNVERRLWIAADFGRGEAVWTAASTLWTELLTQASRRLWIRLVIIASTPARFADFQAILQQPEPPFEEDVQHPDKTMLAEFVDAEIGRRLDDTGRAQARADLDARWTQISAKITPEMQTRAIAHCALAVKEEMVRQELVP